MAGLKPAVSTVSPRPRIWGVLVAIYACQPTQSAVEPVTAPVTTESPPATTAEAPATPGECVDGWPSENIGKQGACSWHQGVRREADTPPSTEPNPEGVTPP